MRDWVGSVPGRQVPAPASRGHATGRAEPRSGSEGVAGPMHGNILSASLLAALELAGCGERNAASADPASGSDAAAGAQDALADWPHVDSAIAADPAIEARVREIVAGINRKSTRLNSSH